MNICLEGYLSSPPTMHPNRMLIPVNKMSFCDADIDAFNDIYKYCLAEEAAGRFKRFTLTPSGAFSTSYDVMRGAGPMWQCVYTRTLIEIVIRDHDARYYRFQIGQGNPNKRERDKPKLSGRQAFTIYCKCLKKHGVTITSLAIDNGKEVKATIPSPKIELLAPPDRTYYNAFHIDINSSFNAGMMAEYPELEPAIRYMYCRRTVDPTYKDVLNMTQGFMQSSLVGYRYAHISRAGYAWTNNKIESLSEKLEAEGFRILAYNTDGIWCQSYSDDIYHDADEGDDIGQWRADWIGCKVRFKSKGNYEVEGYKVKNGVKTYKYEPKLRGQTTYDAVKPRDQWVWGDIYKAEVKTHRWIEGKGIVVNDDLF